MEKTLENGLKALDIQLTESQKQTLCAFGRAVIRQNDVMNLTAITEETQVAWLHLLDSLTVTKAAELKGKLIDVGCGAGFPGVPPARWFTRSSTVSVCPPRTGWPVPSWT